MPFTLTMPKLSPTMEEGVIVKWHKKVGEQVQPGDLLMEVATDKATVEHQALDEGWIRQILIEEGKSARVNQAIAVLSEDPNENLEGYQPEGVKTKAEALQVQEVESGQETSKKESTKPQGSILQQPNFVPEPPLTQYEFAFPSHVLEKRIRVSPLARKIAKERGLDLTSIKGSGPNQRIMKRDLEKALPLQGTQPRREPPKESPGSYEELPLSPMRKVIGQRLQESKSFIPHFYVSQTIDAEPLSNIREQLKQGDIKVSVNDIIVRAVALGLKKHPSINTGFNSLNQSVIQFKTIDIAIAVSVEAGLITPIIRHADYKSVAEIAIEVRYLAKKAREGKLETEEYKGGSFTISNLGMYGVTHFQAIINPPQAAILAVGGIEEIPVIRNQTIVPGKVMTMTLSVDHRVIDGVAAAEFLRSLKELLENPAILLF